MDGKRGEARVNPLLFNLLIANLEEETVKGNVK